MDKNDYIKYKILKVIDNYLETNQRQIAKLVGISLGHCNKFIKEMLKDDYIDMCRDIEYRKRRMIYFLKPKGKNKYIEYCYQMLDKFEKDFDNAKFNYNEMLVVLEKLDHTFCLDDYTRQDILYDMWETKKKGGK